MAVKTECRPAGRWKRLLQGGGGQRLLVVLGLLRSSLGGIGILSVVLLVGPPLLACVWWLLMLSLCGAAAELLLQRPIADWMRSVAGTVKTLIAVLVICALFLIVAVTVVHGAGGGTAG